MERVKEIFIYIRNGLSFLFTWLVICSVILTVAGGNDTISVSYIVKLFVLCLWAVISFTLCFINTRMQKKGFIFSLTLFYILFIPAEIAMFYLMGIFNGRGNKIMWGIFAVVVILMYLAAVLIDYLIMKKKAAEYTQKMHDYVLSDRPTQG